MALNRNKSEKKILRSSVRVRLEKPIAVSRGSRIQPDRKTQHNGLRSPRLSAPRPALEEKVVVFRPILDAHELCMREKNPRTFSVPSIRGFFQQFQGC